MKPNRPSFVVFAIVVLVTLALACPSLAQQAEPQPTEGKTVGNYNVKQSLEFGGRVTSITGNEEVYNTFVNLQPGPRLFGQTLEMRSLDHQGLLFDDLFTTSFGYGGDPNNFTLLRVSKNKWYDFDGTFRRDRNVWDYNLLANPLNPTNSVPTIIITNSPHLMQLSRNMTDLKLTLLPPSPIRVRLGYSHSSNYGPSFSSVHEGTDALLFQDWKTTVNSYQVGVDFKVLPRTSFSYDQFLVYYKGDTSWLDQNLTYQLPNGTPVDLGLPFDTKNRIPCATPVKGFTAMPPTASPKCNGYLFYQRGGPGRTSYPTERFSFQSNYFKTVDLAGSFSYTSSDSTVSDFNEFFSGLVSRSNQGKVTTSGPASAKRTSATTDAAATWYATSKLRVVDEFRFSYFRIPGQASLLTDSLFGTSLLVPPVVFTPANCPPPFTATTCPPHNSSSPADVATSVSSLFLGQDAKVNEVEFEYDFGKRFGGRIGYRYRHRTIFQRDAELTSGLYYPGTAPGVTPPVNAARGACANGPLNADRICTASSSASDSSQTTINENSLLLGLWARPTNSLRLTYDQEVMYADNTFTRISPRRLQHYKLRSIYRPKTWATLSGSMNIYEARNNVTQIDHLEHTRNYGFAVNLAPGQLWSLDFGYNYTGIFSQTNICFIFGSGPPPPGFPPCPVVGSSVPLQAFSFYNSKINYGYADVTLKPLKRVALTAGYSIDSVTGSTLILNPNAPSGPLDFNYHRPYGAVTIDIAKGLAFKTGWGFYDYNEKDQSSDPTGPRSFRGNLVNLSVICWF